MAGKGVPAVVHIQFTQMVLTKPARTVVLLGMLIIVGIVGVIVALIVEILIYANAIFVAGIFVHLVGLAVRTARDEVVNFNNGMRGIRRSKQFDSNLWRAMIRAHGI